MAKETADSAFIGTDFQRTFHVLDEDEAAAIDITGWSMSWMLKRKLSHADAAALATKPSLNIVGAFNATPALNTLRVTLSVADTDTDTLSPGVCYWELKRMDPGLETVVAYGEFELLRGVHRA